MKRSLILSVIIIATGVLSGCGSSPSTPIAPDQQPLDASKMSPEQVDAMLKKQRGESDRSSPESGKVPGPSSGPSGTQPGGVPSGR